MWTNRMRGQKWVKMTSASTAWELQSASDISDATRIKSTLPPHII